MQSTFLDLEKYAFLTSKLTEFAKKYFQNKRIRGLILVFSPSKLIFIDFGLVNINVNIEIFSFVISLVWYC